MFALQETAAAYLTIILIMVSASGSGKAIIDLVFSRFDGSKSEEAKKLLSPTAVALGFACFILVIIILFEFKIHSNTPIALVLLCGILYFLIKIKVSPTLSIDKPLVFVFIFFSSTLVAPLTLPLDWDELMYHLPHARAWVENGELSINENIRYPYFPYNINVLYASAFAFGYDRLPHFIHASFGWITGWLMFNVATLWYSRWIAAAATSLWFILSASHYKNAYIDLGLTLFVFLSLIYFVEWVKDRSLYALSLSGVFFGFGLGTKYQAIFFAIPLIIILIARKPRAKEIFTAAVSISAGSIYWYARNYLITGNPVNPLADTIFGHYDWNSSDIRLQFTDLQRVQENPALAIFILLILFGGCVYKWRDAKTPDKVLAAYSIIILSAWVGLSRYSRYLIPAMPAITIITLHVIAVLMPKKIFEVYLKTANLKLAATILFASIGVIYSTASTIRWSKRVAFDNERINAISAERVAGYSTWKSIGRTQKKIYQIYLEGSIFYAPKNTYGDHFGPWRYSDYVNLNGRELHKKLKIDAFEMLVISNSATSTLEAVAAYPNGFEGVMTSDEASVFIVK